jgi:hypothetical protein
MRQLCTSLQENMCKIVLGKNFDKTLNTSADDIIMEQHIVNLIDDEFEQNAARKIWETLKKDIDWNPYLITAMASFKQAGNVVAHPELTEERIKKR